MVNHCTVEAFATRTISLLPVGVVSVQGAFASGDVVSIQDEQGRELARGVAELSAAQIDQIKGLNSTQAKEKLPEFSRDEVVHRDKLVVF